MPRKVRWISKEMEQLQIIDQCECCYVGMVDENNLPYVLPFNFGIKDKNIYLHSAPEGKKIKVLQKNSRVCAVFSTGHKLMFQHEQVACSYSMSYKSVICYGKVEFIEDDESKRNALNIIMQKYTGKDFSYATPAIKNVCVFRIIVDEITAKEFGNLS